MAKLETSLRFETFFRPMVWGGRGLETKLGKTLPGTDAVGEAWEVSDHSLHQSVVASGPWKGKSLRQLMSEHRVDLLGPAEARFKTFPWLFKYLDCHDWLSVQVHPDTEKVKTLWPGEGSKTEAWFILDAAPASRIYAGLKPGVGPEELRQGIEDGTVADLLHSFAPEPGQCVFLPAGTVHAVGGGVLMAEIQETSDATFRLYDWDRVDAQGKSRTLHVEESLAAIHWDKGPVTPRTVPYYSAPVATHRHPLARCPFFNLDFVQDEGAVDLGSAGALQLIAVISGSGRWTGGEPVTPGEVWIVPAAQKDRTVQAEGSLAFLRATLP